MKKYKCMEVGKGNESTWTVGKIYSQSEDGTLQSDDFQYSQSAVIRGLFSNVYSHEVTFELVTDDKRGDGQATDYYELPEDATQLGDLIRHKHMEHGIGEAFCALYRLNDNGEKLRNLKKALYYITEEISWMEEQE